MKGGGSGGIGVVLYGLGLGLLGAWAWWQDRSWVASAGDVLPILAGIPLMAWLGSPWRLREARGAVARGAFVVGLLGLLAGAAGGYSTGYAIAFGAFAWVGIGLWLEGGEPVRPRLMTLAVLAFPWVLQDFAGIGWYFRLSGAAVTEWLFRVVGMSVSRKGVDLVVENLPMSVEAQCAGLNSLQAMLLAGAFLACRFFPRHGVFWAMLPLCVGAAWVGNTVRIVSITVAGLTFGVEFAMGAFHKSGGLVALLVTFGLAAGSMRLVRGWVEPGGKGEGKGEGKEAGAA